MYGLIFEYAPGIAPATLWQLRQFLARQPGYRRRLELQADGYQRLADVCLFATPETAEAARAARPDGPRLAPALLVREGDGHGLGPVVVLRRAPDGAPGGGSCCWRDRFEPAAPAVELW
ncbi:MAG TPA: hypothetical protein VFW96_29580 [Thermomicrobiales bacterium]|nr:hypothetical protein [Thermomicrobiales bacterium]